jgi:hypothetical protein
MSFTLLRTKGPMWQAHVARGNMCEQLSPFSALLEGVPPNATLLTKVCVGCPPGCAAAGGG